MTYAWVASSCAMPCRLMMPSFKIDRGVSLMTMPTDVRCYIAYLTVSLACDTPVPSDLVTVLSLSRTCRLFYAELAMRHNPDLYANIFRLMFDVAPVKRRLGTPAVTSSSLASELKERVAVLKRIKNCFIPSTGCEGRWDTMLPVFNRAVLMMIENDGKNRRQLLNIAGATGIPAALASREMTGDITPNPALAAFVSLTELGLTEEELTQELPDRRFMILDLLQPFVVSKSWLNLSDNIPLQHRDLIATIEYFGRRCRFRPMSLILLARLCTVARYKALRKIYSSGSDRTCFGSMTPTSSARFDNDWSWYFTIDCPPFTESKVGPHVSHGYTLGIFDGVWEGQLLIPSAPPQNFTCALPMQSILREFVSICAEDTVTLEGGEDDDGQELTRAWFPEGVKFEENTFSINIYDPVKARWLTYLSASDIIKSSDNTQGPNVFDTVLIGITDQTHGESHGDYKFHGRVRNSGRVALVRKPTDPRMVDLGIWVFHGKIHVGTEFIGDWRNTSETDTNTPAVQGWFQLSRVSDELIS